MALVRLCVCKKQTLPSLIWANLNVFLFTLENVITLFSRFNKAQCVTARMKWGRLIPGRNIVGDDSSDSLV